MILSDFKFQEKIEYPIKDIIERLIESNKDFKCSDCIETIQILIEILDEFGIKTDEYKEDYNTNIHDWY